MGGREIEKVEARVSREVLRPTGLDLLRQHQKIWDGDNQTGERNKLWDSLWSNNLHKDGRMMRTRPVQVRIQDYHSNVAGVAHVP